MTGRTFDTNLHQLLSSGNFEVITKKQWEEIILSLIADEIEMEAQYDRLPLPSWVYGVSSVGAASALGANTRDTGAVGASALRLDDLLSTKARLVFSEALTSVAETAYESFKASGYQDNQIKAVVDEALIFSSLLDGAIRADVTEKMALDTKFPNRARALANLVGQSFRNGAPPTFWKKIENQLSWAPELAHLVMEQYLEENDEPISALQALKHVPKPVHGVGTTLMIARAIEGAKRYSNGRDVLRKTLSELPPWVQDLVSSKEFQAAYPAARKLS